jgi:hypothetical protein
MFDATFNGLMQKQYASYFSKKNELLAEMNSLNVVTNHASPVCVCWLFNKARLNYT